MTPGDQHQGRELRLVADGDQDHECAANEVLKIKKKKFEKILTYAHDGDYNYLGRGALALK